MSFNPFLLLSLFVSAFISFSTAALTIEILIRICRIKRYRLRSSLRLLPFFCLLADPFLNQYSLSQLINPLSCKSCMQQNFLKLFFPQLESHLVHNQISLLNYLKMTYQHPFFSWALMALMGVSIFLTAKKLIPALMLMRSLHQAKRRALPCKRTINSIELAKELKKNDVAIYLSNEIQIPLALYSNVIIVPHKTNEILSQEEFEAVIAHEWEHLKHKDALTRMLSHLVAALFWWVPIQSWMRKMQQEQEQACDQNISKYSLPSDSIASALFKVAKQIKIDQTICCFSQSENSTLARIKIIYGIATANQNPLFGIVFFGGFFLLMYMTCF